MYPHALLALFATLIFAPVLFGKLAFFGEEQSGFYYAISEYVYDSIRAGKPLVWISNYYGGAPASLDQFVSAWYPLNRVLFSLFGTFTAHHLSITIATAAGLIGSYLFGRAQGWLVSSSLSLAIMYFLATTYGWILIGTTAAHSFAILPFLLLAAHLASRGKYVAGILIGSTALGIGFLAGFMQIVFYDFAVAGAYALFLDWNAFEKVKPIWKNLYVSYSYSAITLLGLALGFLQFYPSSSMIDLTIRTSSYASQHATYPNITEFVAVFLPPYFSVPFFGGGSSSGLYIGVLGLIFGVVSLWYYRTRVSVFFTGLYILILGFAFHLPFFGWLNEHVPPFSHMGGNFRWMVAAAFPLAFIGAAGIEGFLRYPEKVPRRILKWIIGASITLSALLIAGSIFLAHLAQIFVESPEKLNTLLQWYTQGRTLSFPHEHYVAILSGTVRDFAYMFSLTNPRFVFGVSLWVLGAGILYLVHSRRDTHIPTLITTFMFVTGFGHAALQWNELVPQSLYQEPALSRVIQSQGEAQHEYRVFGYLVGEGSFLKLASQKLTPVESTSLQMQTLVNNTSLFFGFDRMDGMEPYRTLRHNHLLDTVIVYGSAVYVFDDESPSLQTSALDQLYNRDVQKKVSLEEKLTDLPKRLPLLSMMNVKYLYSPFELEDPTLTEIAQVPITTSTSGYPMFVYENTRVLPRVYAAQNVQFAQSEREALIGVIREKDFAKNSWIECTGCDAASGKAGISIERYEGGVIDVSVNALDDTWIIVSESSFPGWKATIDGDETPIYSANYLFQAVRVPKGEHVVSLTYHDIAVDAITSLFR